MVRSQRLCLGLQGDVAVQRSSKFQSHVSYLRLRDEFPQDEASLITSGSVLKTSAKTSETNVTPGLKSNSKQTFSVN